MYIYEETCARLNVVTMEPCTCVANAQMQNHTKKSKTASTMLKDTNVINAKLDTLSKTSQSEKPIYNENLGLPSELSYLDNDSNELHHLADTCLLKII